MIQYRGNLLTKEGNALRVWVSSMWRTLHLAVNSCMKLLFPLKEITVIKPNQ